MNYKRFYIENSMVFITMVTYQRNKLLLNHTDLIKQALLYTKTKYKFIIIAYVILEDHIHLILKPEIIEDYPNIIKTFKTYLSRNIKVQNVKLTKSMQNKNEKGIWQSRYWAHVILDKDDLYRHLDYIHYNPMKHYQITPKDWEFSSFKNFGEKGLYELDWYNFEDKNDIKDLNFE